MLRPPRGCGQTSLAGQAGTPAYISPQPRLRSPAMHSPTHPPTQQAEQVEGWEGLPQSLKLEVGSPQCFLCERPQRLVVLHPMRGHPKIFALEKKVGGWAGGRGNTWYWMTSVWKWVSACGPGGCVVAATRTQASGKGGDCAFNGAVSALYGGPARELQPLVHLTACLVQHTYVQHLQPCPSCCRCTGSLHWG